VRPDYDVMRWKYAPPESFRSPGVPECRRACRAVPTVLRSASL